jgi:AcrR family transcriptional regulator
MERSEPRGPGRPMDVALHDAILDAALAELAEAGFEGLSVERVARRAAAAKTSVYRRWPTKEALTLAAVRHFIRSIPGPPAAQGRSALTFRRELLAHARHLASVLTRERVAVLAGLLLAMRSRRELATVLQEEFVRGEVRALTDLARRAAARGEVAGRPPTAAVLHVLPGVLLTRLFVLDQPLDDAFLQQLVDDVLIPLFGGRAGQRARQARSQGGDR